MCATMYSMSTNKILAIRVKPETAEYIRQLAQKEQRNPGQQLDVIIDSLRGTPVTSKAK